MERSTIKSERSEEIGNVFDLEDVDCDLMGEFFKYNLPKLRVYSTTLRRPGCVDLRAATDLVVNALTGFFVLLFDTGTVSAETSCLTNLLELNFLIV